MDDVRIKNRVKAEGYQSSRKNQSEKLPLLGKTGFFLRRASYSLHIIADLS